MRHAEICPVCKGEGKITRSRLKGAIVEYNMECHGCGGMGWIEVSDGARLRKKERRPHRPLTPPVVPHHGLRETKS